MASAACYPAMDTPDTDQISKPEDQRKPAGPERYLFVALVILALAAIVGLIAFAA